MQHDEFIAQVRHRANLRTTGDAELATRATLETLAERLAGNEANNAAAQLPKGIAQYLQHQYAGAGVRLSLDEFYQRISLREGVELQQAVNHAHAVIEVLSEAISSGEMEDIRTQLPPEYEPLFGLARQGKMHVKT
ncbi:DUF2267 domain-containing protein [Nostoc sp. MS1]|uniref:DUF2267 domain-containing protein n=1 Tax=Nostoc sp. MS1 TaxID=2764711 RepID=UPI001CC5ED6C|nr:DUF2267 domain-containing protein [Nostoc sp. MS1]BCL34563.1 hypothetical protein NSMS1_10100 [Nostoc sp. MS1]